MERTTKRKIINGYKIFAHNKMKNMIGIVYRNVRQDIVYNRWSNILNMFL